MFKISWMQHEEEHASVDGVDAALELGDTGDCISIGLGADRSVLNYVGASGDPPYFTSRGEQAGDAFISFRFGGEWSEFPAHNSVPTSLARAAVRRFCETGKLPSEIDWEEV
jgi:hypothetical protein